LASAFGYELSMADHLMQEPQKETELDRRDRFAGIAACIRVIRDKFAELSQAAQSGVQTKQKHDLSLVLRTIDYHMGKHMASLENEHVQHLVRIVSTMSTDQAMKVKTVEGKEVLDLPSNLRVLPVFKAPGGSTTDSEPIGVTFFR